MTDVLQPAFVPSVETDRLAVDTLRFLAADMVQTATSGHPGMSMGAAPMAWTLWSRHLRHDPTAPDWADRDRFVLSAGHGSALLYGLLHLFGYDLPEAELRGFRQLGSHTPGHPEHGETPGVECTTRFAAYGWHTEAVLDGTDIEAIDQAIIRAKADPQPSFIAVRTVTGNGAPGVEGTANARAGDARSTA